MRPDCPEPNLSTSDDAPAAALSDRSLLGRFRRGSEDAATQIYLRYAERLRALARARCSPALASRVDADDIVQSVFRSFFQAAQRGSLQITTGEDLWRILLVIALNKIRNEHTFHRAAKRDVRLTSGGDSLDRASQDAKADGEDHFLQMAIDETLEALPPRHRSMVELRIQGRHVAEIAVVTGRSKRSVERTLQEARDRFEAILHGA